MEIQRLREGEEGRLRAIRLRSLRDAPDAFASTAGEAEAHPPESWTEQLASLPTFVAVDEGRDVGVVRYAPDRKRGDTAFLISMWVAPEARGRGIGSALVEALVEYARSEGFARMELDVGDHNAAAIALYAKKGFGATGERGRLAPPREHLREHRRVLVLGE